MAQQMLDNFFVDSYFQSSCTCHLNSEENGGHHCNVHEKIILSAQPEYAPTLDVNHRINVRQVEINQSFPRQPPQDYLTQIIEYRIRLVLSDGEVIKSGEMKTIQTNVNITRKSGKLSILLKGPENLPLRFNSEGLLNPAFRGILSVCFENATSENIHLSAGSNVGYLILTPFIQ